MIRWTKCNVRAKSGTSLDLDIKSRMGMTLSSISPLLMTKHPMCM
jgi:hypothetical protein